MGAAIPRLLHQHYFPGEAALPPAVRAVREALLAANPGWTDCFWDAGRAESFIGDTFGDGVLSRYRRIAPEYYAARSDFLRYLTLYAMGGVYLDIKSTCDRPLDAAIRPDDRFLLMHFPHLMEGARPPEVDRVYMSNVPELGTFPNGEYVQWVIVSAPGHPYLKAVIASVLRGIDRYTPLTHGVGKYGVIRLTGPVLYTRTIDAIRDRHPHSGPMSIAERGFVFSGLGDQHSHEKVNTDGRQYYGRLSLPILDTSPAMRVLTRAMLRSYRSPRLKRAWRGIHSRMLSRAWTT